MIGGGSVNQGNNGFYRESFRAEHTRQEGHVLCAAKAVILQRLDFKACASDAFAYA